MKNTISPFSLGSNVLVEILNGVVRQLNAETGGLIREIPVESLSAQQVAAIESRRQACAMASISQGFQKAGYVNEV